MCIHFAFGEKDIPEKIIPISKEEILICYKNLKRSKLCMIQVFWIPNSNTLLHFYTY